MLNNFFKIKVIAFIILSLLFLTACDDELDFSQYEKVKVNTYFYFPNDTEVYLGEHKGASACADAAYSYAKSKKLDNSDEWSYICCTIRKGSSCYEKIR